MKRARYKRLHRILTFYTHNFQLRRPFTVLLDGTFCAAALGEQINIREQLVKYLEDAQCRIATTRCCLRELESLGSTLYGALHIVRQFDVSRCGHAQSATLPAARCLALSAKRAAKAGRRAIVATQDRSLTEALRQRHGQPIVFVRHKTVIMEKPSDISRSASAGIEKRKLDASGFDGDRLAQLMTLRLGAESADGPPVRKKHRGPKGPNPLSCKKSKKAKGKGQSGTSAKATPVDATQRRRKRSRPGDDDDG